MAVKPIPEGYHTITPYLVVDDARRALDFMRGAFGAAEVARFVEPGGRIMHAEVMIGDSRVMVGQAAGGFTARPATLHVYITDCDAAYKQALAAGGSSLREPSNQFYGDRTAGIADPCGNQWWLATHIEDVSDDEMKRRMKEAQ